VCVCRLRFPPCNAHAPYCHLWPARLRHIRTQYVNNGTIFFGGGDVIEHKMCFDFLYKFLSEIFLIRRRIQLDMIKKSRLVFMWQTLYGCQIEIHLEFSRQIFEKSSNIRFYESPFRGSRVVQRRQTDRRDEAKIPFSQFCERSPKLQNLKTCVSSPLVSGPERTQTTPFLGSSLHLNPQSWRKLRLIPFKV
jgi:hypothetical protein